VTAIVPNREGRLLADSGLSSKTAYDPLRSFRDRWSGHPSIGFRTRATGLGELI